MENVGKKVEAILLGEDRYFSSAADTTRHVEGVNHVASEYDAKRLTQTPIIGFFYETLVSRLMQIPARRKNSQVLADCYAFAKPNTDSGVDGLVPAGWFPANANEDYMKDFLTCLIEGAKTASGSEYKATYATGKPTNTENFSRIVIAGKRGCGKTMFLNKLLITNRDELDSNHVIWLRVNLTFPAMGWSVMNRVYHRCLCLLREHYLLDERSDHHFTQFSLAQFGSFLREKHGNHGKDLFRDFLNIESLNLDYSPGPHLSPQDVAHKPPPDELFELAMEYLIDVCGYSVSLILDGLDLIDPTTIKEKEFEQWLNQAHAFFWRNGDRYSKVICLRDETFDQFAAERSGFASPRRPHFVVKVVPADPQTIAEKRFMFAADEVSSDRDREDPDMLGRFQAIYAALIGFIAAGLHSDPHEVLGRVYDLVDHDGRRYLHVLRMLLKRLIHHVEDRSKFVGKDEAHIWKEAMDGFFEVHPLGKWQPLTENGYPNRKWKTLFSTKSYDVIETLTIGKYRFHHCPYVYKLGVDDSLLVIRNQKFTFDAGPFPNLLGFSIELAFKNPPACQPAILFCKILVLAYLHEFAGGSSEQEIYVSDFCNRLGAPAIVVDAAIHELVYYGAIERAFTTNEQLRLTGSGAFCLTTLLTEQSYFLGIQNSVPYPRQDKAAFKHYDPKAESPSQYMPRRLRNTIYFTRYVIERFDELKSTADPADDEFPVVFARIERILSGAVKNMRTAWERIVAEASSSSDSEFKLNIQRQVESL